MSASTDTGPEEFADTSCPEDSISAGTGTLPFLTTSFEGIGGVIKTREEDFFVEELPLYQPCGQGSHAYVLIEKKGTGTMEALGSIARALGMRRRDIGYAGLKDARAVARQWISIENVPAETLMQLQLPRVKIIRVERHDNKLRLGHLAANRFSIRLRRFNKPMEEALAIVENVMADLTKRGVPNYYGSQRFGSRNDTHLLGEAVAKGKIEEFIDIFLGRPDENELPTIYKARKLYEQGDYQGAVDAWPYIYADQRRVLRALLQKKGSRKKAYHAVDRHMKGFFISAYQSDLFNRVTVARMPAIDKLLTGDMAYKHINGACFRVEDAALEQPRCDNFEISPTGPMLGYRMSRLTGPAGDIENAILDSAGLTDRDFQQMKEYGGRGARRPLRFRPDNSQILSGIDDLGPYIELKFELPSSCYATCLLREITKTNV